MTIRRSYKTMWPKSASGGAMTRLNCILVLSLKQREWLPGHSEPIDGNFNLLYIEITSVHANPLQGSYVQSCHPIMFVHLGVKKKQFLKEKKKRRLRKAKRSNRVNSKYHPQIFVSHVFFQTSWRSFHWDTLIDPLIQIWWLISLTINQLHKALKKKIH